MTNENNYIGATLTLVGYASAEARSPAYDKDGSKGILEISIPVNEGYKKDGEFVQTGTTWYTYSAAGDYAAALSAIQKGDKLRIDEAKQEIREYEDKNGVKQKGISLRYGSLTVLESKSSAPAGDVPPW
jgi:hypothetical protein